jgi:long-subunit acyl-CoA synthetase (AMP-forming)
MLTVGREAIADGRGVSPAAWPGRDDVATLVFTSGTTREPKAAALTHGNVLYQVEALPFFIEVRVNEQGEASFM